MNRLVLLLTLLVFTTQFLNCSPKNLWENDDSNDVMSVEATSNTSVEIVFSSEVDATTAQTAANYSITDAGGTVLAVNDPITLSGDNKTVLLPTASQSNKEYTLIVTNVTTLPASNGTSKTIDTTDNPNKFSGHELPFLVSATRNPNNIVTLTFSEAVDASSAVYTILPVSTLTITPTAITSGTEINIVTSSQIDDVTYTVTVNNVTELNNPGDGIDTTRNSATFTGCAYPTVTGFTMLPNYVLQITFSKTLNTASANIKSNYSIVEAALPTNILDFTINSVSSNVVEIVTNAQTQDVLYEIAIQGITDTLGNQMIPYSNTFNGDAKPRVTSAYALYTPSILMVTFSEDMLAGDLVTDSVENYTNYTLYKIDALGGNIISTETSNITSAAFDTPYTVVLVDICCPLTSNQFYRITLASNVEDKEGSAIDPAFCSFDFQAPAAP